LITKDELQQYVQIKEKYPNVYVYWTPIVWAVNLLSKAYQEGRIKSDSNFRTEILSIRGKLGSLTAYDWITIPLVYTQVITVAVHGYFALCLLGRQYVARFDPADPSTVDLLFPFFTFLQFVFYMGWLKVAQVIMNPFGEDDDDFEYILLSKFRLRILVIFNIHPVCKFTFRINFLLDRHVAVAYMIVDDFCDHLPPLVRDTFWKEESIDLPHTKASVNLKNNPLVGSASVYQVPKRLQSIVEETGDGKSRMEHNNVLKSQMSAKTISIDDIIDSLAS
uniref:Bestrophin homolog n=1 Tax=Romanomermis culicivorax TaxID=13658 RepID=A0A915J165_ROMCU